jgi:hypothetical protein
MNKTYSDLMGFPFGWVYSADSGAVMDTSVRPSSEQRGMSRAHLKSLWDKDLRDC